jgi:hypothetical protein
MLTEISEEDIDGGKMFLQNTVKYLQVDTMSY